MIKKVIYIYATKFDFIPAYTSGVNVGSFIINGVEKICFVPGGNMSQSIITIPTGPYIFNGDYITPEPTVTLNDVPLTKDTDYTVSYINNLNIGTATCIVTGKNSYSGSKNSNFEIYEQGITGGVWTEDSGDRYIRYNENPSSRSEFDGPGWYHHGSWYVDKISKDYANSRWVIMICNDLDGWKPQLGYVSTQNFTETSLTVYVWGKTRTFTWSTT